MKLLIVIERKSDFVKASAITKAILKYNASKNLINAYLIYFNNDHFDGIFYKFIQDLELKKPEEVIQFTYTNKIDLISKAMKNFKEFCLKYKPNLVILLSESDAALAAALVASKLCIHIAHLNAGLRNYLNDNDELNRKIIDHISDYLFAESYEATSNLKKEGIPDYKIFLIGSVLIDTLLKHKERAAAYMNPIISQYEFNDYAITYLRNPIKPELIKELSSAFLKISQKIPIIFIANKKNSKKIEPIFEISSFKDIRIFSHPYFCYTEFIRILSEAKIILTDSSNIQEEAAILGMPCLILKERTEKPFLVQEGTSIVVGSNPSYLINTAYGSINTKIFHRLIPNLWDGCASERMIDILLSINYTNKH